MNVPARFWHPLSDGRLQCDLCPRDCKLREGQKGFCFVRERQGDQMVLATWGRSAALCVDPIEKKPLAHFYPGSSVLSFGTAGCNLGCRFCQNWDLTKTKVWDERAQEASPDEIASAAVSLGCKSVAFTYNEPTVFAEYAMDVAEACHARGLQTVAVTSGYIRSEPRRAFTAKLDAANVDLKGFTEDFYQKQCLGHLQPVLDTLSYIAKETQVWLEVTTLLIPGLNDSEEEVERLSDWFIEHLGPSVPLHLSAFHPDYKLLDKGPTPPALLRRARAQARRAGLLHVYVGNMHDREGDTTWCASCGEELIVRDWYEVLAYNLTAEGRCPKCGKELAGRFDAKASAFGRQRIPLRLREVR